VNAPEKPKIIGDVFIHPHAVVHPTATVSTRTVVISLTVIETETFGLNTRMSDRLKLVIKDLDKFIRSWKMTSDKCSKQLAVAAKCK